MRRRAILSSLFIFALSIVSTTFVLLALTSPRWAVQKYYLNLDGSSSLGTDWIHPICIAHKSPFYRCEPPVINTTTSPPVCTVPNCQFYAPYGRNRTSCRLAAETNDTDPNSVTNAGEQECQEVHWTGNLQIAATVFITLGLILLIPITAANVLLGVGSSSSSNTAPTVEASEISTGKTKDHPLHHHPQRQKHKFSTFTPPLILATILFLSIGAILQFVAQFFGVLGLTINGTPFPDQAIQHNRDILGATPWIMDKALTAYASVAWTMAGAGAVGVGMVYRVPRWEKFL
ncbi:uncharacterized protein PAC_02606 [Phialocephala subalpina]|uniref:Uncharacterized protein n=1 Tax=Phialocephala subalpina TaxID=576137 RepID=A0A1L7WIX6_9HELO|nr:uncharacterized protein PAC_02606 [Phialocephala subalpina]